MDTYNPFLHWHVGVPHIRSLKSSPKDSIFCRTVRFYGGSVYRGRKVEQFGLEEAAEGLEEGIDRVILKRF